VTKPRNIPCQACGHNPDKKISYQHEETIRFKWKSGNLINPPGHNSRWVYREYRKKFGAAFATVGHNFTRSDNFRRITLTRVYGKGPKGGSCYPFDDDNLAQGAKPIIDYLVTEGLLRDDSPSDIERVYKQEASEDGKHYMKIRIEEFDESK